MEPIKPPDLDSRSVGEELILPAAVEMCNLILGEKAAREIRKLSLPDSTVQRRITEMSKSLKSLVV